MKEIKSHDDDDDEYDELANALVQVLYDFLLDPQSSWAAYIWTVLMAFLVVMYMLVLTLQSLDGPNHYEGRVEMSSYGFLMTDQSYFYALLGCMVPLLIDSFGKVILLLQLRFNSDNAPLYDIYKTHNFDVVTTWMDIIGTVPFLAYLFYIRPQGLDVSDWTEYVRCVYRLFELMSLSRILRLTKDWPSIWAVRETLTKAAPHLVLPVFFFALFNVAAAVLMFFIEPCFDDGSCPWHDLFESTFFTVVSMTTVGYGNQSPNYELGRFIAIVICLFGLLFISMPLAIIGNEYETAWSQVTFKMKREKAEKEKLQREKEELVRQYKSKNGGGRRNDMSQGVIGAGFNNTEGAAKKLETQKLLIEDARKREKVERDGRELEQAIENSQLMTCLVSLRGSTERLNSECEDGQIGSTLVHPGILQGMLETRDWLLPLVRAVNMLSGDMFRAMAISLLCCCHILYRVVH